ncbi:unnamed protein product [Ilex paraguariensis]|uniref:Uncharacterized protein n=1 Tax=Ilex paraguariensis TaxID=185542 RepID=A0ABC8UTL4_9AQUA
MLSEISISCAGMTTRLWKYVSTFSNLSGERLHQIYSKLKQEQGLTAGVGPSHINGSAPGHQTSIFHKGYDTGKFEAWKRRRRAEETHSQVQIPHHRSLSNDTRIPEPNSLGILGAGPSNDRHFDNGRPYRTHQTGLPPRQGFSSGVK